MKSTDPTSREQELFTGNWCETAETITFHTVIFPLTSFPILPSPTCPCLPVTTPVHVTQVTMVMQRETFRGPQH